MRIHKMDELQALSYFSSLTHISRKVAFQEKSLIKHLGNKWAEYSPEQQEELFNDLCVPQFIRDEQPPVADDDNGIPQCWPTLKLPSGEKIIVDENDIWTWRDEHSGPFSWKSKSQQDLTLLDLEPDVLTKPHSKTPKTSESDEQPVSSFRRLQFVPSHNSWTEAVLEDYFANCMVEVQTPVHTPSSPQSPAESPSEEINEGFEGSLENLSPPGSPVHTAHPPKFAKTDAEGVMPKGKSKGLKTPSPKKIPHSTGIISKKDGKGDSGHQLLIVDQKTDEERNAFTNPALELEWSNFVGQSSTDPDEEVSPDTQASCKLSSSAEPSTSSHQQSPPPVVEPEAMVMDRGGICSGEVSVESTPDHTTHLLKTPAALVEEAEKEEVLYVVDDGAGSVSVSSTLVPTPSTPNESILRSGFDFLDNW